MSDMVPKTPRADAVRNRDALVEAGKRLFSKHGPDINFEDVAREAGVGKGTLYRHFATRDQLVAAVLSDRFTALAGEADALLDSSDPWLAVETWLRSFDSYPTRSRSLAPRVGEGLADESSAMSTACRPMKDAFERLLTRAQDAGAVRPDIDRAELLTVIASFPQQFRDARGTSPFLEVVLRGLRP